MNNNTSDAHADKFSQSELRDMIANYVEPQRVPGRINIITDTSDFFRVEYDDVVLLEGRPYFVRNYEREGRFGIDDQPKFWVRRAIDLMDGTTKIIKMVFREKFKARVGDIVFHCVRSPKKEARILQLVRGHPSFMQGFSTRDRNGNIIRVIDYIRGASIDTLLTHLDNNHEDFFYSHFPSVLDDYIELVAAIEFLHNNGEKHGDIRRDHILKEKNGGCYRWIDFDFNYWHEENMFGYDLFGLGNILVYLAGQRDITIQDLIHDDHQALEHLSDDDMNIFFNNRVMNLRKLYPYIPEELNIVLLHFSKGAHTFYDTTGQFLSDLREVKDILDKY